MTRRGQFAPRQSMKGQGIYLKRVLQFVMKRYAPLVVMVVLLIGVNTWCTLQGTLFTRTLIDDYISPMIRYGQQNGTENAEIAARAADAATASEEIAYSEVMSP